MVNFLTSCLLKEIFIFSINCRFKGLRMISHINRLCDTWSPAEIWTMKQAIAQAGYQHLALMMEGWQKLWIFFSVVVCISQRFLKILKKKTNHAWFLPFSFKIIQKTHCLRKRGLMIHITYVFYYSYIGIEWYPKHIHNCKSWHFLGNSLTQ